MRDVTSASGTAGITHREKDNIAAAKGDNGRNSDNTLIEQYLGWEPDTRLRDGMARTCAWIHDEYMAKYQAGVTTA